MHYDYGNMPSLSRDGLKNTQGKYLTIALFYETWQDSTIFPMWTLGEAEVFDERQNCWLPSAYLTYINCRSEYEAARKIVGSLKQWEMLKKLKWFQEALAVWQLDQTEQQKLKVREMLLAQAAEGNVNAAKALLSMIDKEGAPSVGRPPKKKATPEINSEVEDDADRLGGVVQFK